MVKICMQTRELFFSEMTQFCHFYIEVSKNGKFDYRVMLIKLKIVIGLQENIVITLCFTEHK